MMSHLYDTFGGNQKGQRQDGEQSARLTEQDDLSQQNIQEEVTPNKHIVNMDSLKLDIPGKARTSRNNLNSNQNTGGSPSKIKPNNLQMVPLG